MLKNLAKKEFNLSFSRQINLDDRINFFGQLAIMLKAGLSLSDGLQILLTQAKGNFRKFSDEIYNSVLAGNSLAVSLEKTQKFADLEVEIIKAGEESGNLESNLRSLSLQLEKEKDIRDKVKAAMVYPIIILCLSLILGLLVSFIVLPKITPIFKSFNTTLPLSTRVLIWISGFVENNFVALLVGIIIFIAAFLWTIRQKFSKPVIHYIFLHFPLLKHLSQSNNISALARNLSLLLKSGLALDKALSITVKTMPNYYFQKNLATASLGIIKGEKLSDFFEKNIDFYPQLATKLVLIGEKSGTLEDSMSEISDYYQKKVDESVKILSAFIEPLLLVGIGLLVAWLAVSVITPIYQVTSFTYK